MASLKDGEDRYGDPLALAEPRERYVIKLANGDEVPIRGAATIDSAMRVFCGPWRRSGDKLIHEKLISEWQWAGEEVGAEERK